MPPALPFAARETHYILRLLNAENRVLDFCLKVIGEFVQRCETVCVVRVDRYVDDGKHVVGVYLISE